MQKEQPSVAIIGGGVSGLSAAHRWIATHPEGSCVVIEGKSTVGGWCKTVQAEGLHDRVLEGGARVILNNEDALPFYELAHFGGGQQLLNSFVSSSNECRTSFAHKVGQPDHDWTSNPWVEKKTDEVLPKLLASKEKEMFAKVNQYLEQNEEATKFLQSADPSIDEFMLSLPTENFGSREDLQQFIDTVIQTKLKTSFYGSTKALSAQVILSRMVPSISIPPVALPSTPLDGYPIEVQQAYKKSKADKAFFIAPKLGFSSVLGSLREKLIETGRATFIEGDAAEGLHFQDGEASITLSSGKVVKTSKAVAAIDGLALRKLLSKTSGIDDLEEIKSSLNSCVYGDMAVCNIVYKDELAAAIKDRMPPSIQHIYLVNDPTKEEAVTVTQILNMTNFMPTQTSGPSSSNGTTVHMNFNVELSSLPDELTEPEASSLQGDILTKCHDLVLESLHLKDKFGAVNAGAAAAGWNVSLMKRALPYFKSGGQLEKLKYLAHRPSSQFQVTGNYISRSSVTFALKMARSQISKM